MESELETAVVTTARSAPIANLLTQILRDAGIPATCDGTTDVDLLLDQDPIGDQCVEVRVPRRMLAHARDVLAATKPQDSDQPSD